MANLRIFCDGGSRGNPGPSAVAFIVYEDGKEIYREGKFIGKGTNNKAEYTAVVQALNWLLFSKRAEDNIDFFLDSQLTVYQLTGRYSVKALPLFELHHKVKQLENFFKNKINYHHIPREENTEADALLNKVMDEFLT